MSQSPKQLVAFLLEDDPDTIRPKDYLPHLDNQMPSPQAELAGIERWVRDSGNAIGEMKEGWEWDAEARLLTIWNHGGIPSSTFTGKDIADSSPGDWRLNRLRGP